MSFLNPLILIGLVVAAIPLIIHLFNFRRPRKIDFSSLVFLKELQKSTMQRVRIKQWLLLLLRTLALACLVFAFARPTLQGGLAGTLGGRAPTSTVLVVDNSQSMTLRDAGGDYLSQARDVAVGIIDQMEDGDEVFILTTAGTSEVSRRAFATRSAARDAVLDIEPRAGAFPLQRALTRGIALLENSSNLNREVYLISDLQKSTLLDSLEKEAEPDIRTILVPVGDRSYSNVAVTSVQVASRIIEEGQPVRIVATLNNYGSERIDDYVASIFLDGERVAQTTATLDPNSSSNVEFSLIPDQRGWLSGEVQIEDDAYTYDNTRFFTLHVPERRSLLLVRGEGQTMDYLDLVLSPDLTEGRVRFDVDTIAESELPARSLGAYDAVVLAGPRDFSSGEITALTRYVEDGGGLLLFPSAMARMEDYNALSSSLGAGTFTGFSGNAGNRQVIATFDRVDYEHMLFEGIFDLAQNRQDERQLERVDVYSAINYTAGPGSEQSLIQLSHGFPFLQEVRHGNGVAFFMAVAPDPAWSDLPVRGLFIPLIYRSIYYVSSTESVTGERFIAGNGGELRIAGLAADETLRLVGPGDEEYAPAQRRLFGATLMEIGPELVTPGIYDVLSGDRLVRRIALNTNDTESNLATASGREAANLLGERSGAEVELLEAAESDADQIVRTLQEQRVGTEVWNVFLLLALIFLVAEMFVARRWRPESVPA